MVVDDLEHNRPELILVDEARVKPFFNQREFDFLSFFNEDAEFRKVWSWYTRISRIGNMGIYQRRFEK